MTLGLRTEGHSLLSVALSTFNLFKFTSSHGITKAKIQSTRYHISHTLSLRQIHQHRHNCIKFLRVRIVFSSNVQHTQMTESKRYNRPSTLSH